MGMSKTEKLINDLNVSKLMLCNSRTLTPELCIRIGQAINSAIDLLKRQEAFINRLYHEIKARWNIRRQMPDASGEELKFLADLLDRMEADGDEQELLKEGDGKKLTDAEIKELMEAIDRAPLVPFVDAVPVVHHGTWIPLDTGDAYDFAGVKTWALRARCSRCGLVHKFIEAHTGQYVYCPSCGAKMDREAKEGDSE